MGSNSTVQSSNSITIADNAFISNSENSYSFGKGTTVSSRPNSMVVGFYNSNPITDDVFTVGNGNFAPNANNIISGSNNQIQGSSSINNIVTGSGNDVTFTNSISVGVGLVSTLGTSSQGLFGTFNNPNFNSKLTVGIGSNDGNRKNGLEVLTNGLVVAPSSDLTLISNSLDNKVLTTKEYVDNTLTFSKLLSVLETATPEQIIFFKEIIGLS